MDSGVADPHYDVLVLLETSLMGLDNVVEIGGFTHHVVVDRNGSWTALAAQRGLPWIGRRMIEGKAFRRSWNGPNMRKGTTGALCFGQVQSSTERQGWAGACGYARG